MCYGAAWVPAVFILGFQNIWAPKKTGRRDRGDCWDRLTPRGKKGAGSRQAGGVNVDRAPCLSFSLSQRAPPQTSIWLPRGWGRSWHALTWLVPFAVVVTLMVVATISAAVALGSVRAVTTILSLEDWQYPQRYLWHCCCFCYWWERGISSKQVHIPLAQCRKKKITGLEL